MLLIISLLGQSEKRFACHTLYKSRSNYRSVIFHTYKIIAVYNIEQATDRYETAAVNKLILSWTKTFLFDSVYGHQDTDWLCDVPSISSRGAKQMSHYSYS